MDSSPTWGIEDPDFLKGFTAAAFLLTCSALAVRRWGGENPPSSRNLGVYELAYLNGERRVSGGDGAGWAIDTALVSLWVDGLVEKGGDGELRGTGRDGTASDPLAEAVLHAIGDRAVPADVRRHPAVLAALAPLEEAYRELKEEALRGHAARQARSMKTLPLFTPLLSAGAVRLAAGLANGRPVGRLTAALTVLEAEVLLLRKIWRPDGARSALLERLMDKTLDDAGRRYRKLMPHPGMVWRGRAAEAALSRAVFGNGHDSLWRLAPSVVIVTERQPSEEPPSRAPFTRGSSYGGAYSGRDYSGDICGSNGGGGGGCGSGCGGCGGW